MLFDVGGGAMQHPLEYTLYSILVLALFLQQIFFVFPASINRIYRRYVQYLWGAVHEPVVAFRGLCETRRSVRDQEERADSCVMLLIEEKASLPK